MAKIGKAILQREIDDQYTLLVYVKDDADPSARFRLQSTTPNLSLTAAFNGGRDALGPLATGALKHEEVMIQTVMVEPSP